ncbi:hypothetical protein PHYSODRAFT_329615 [Phytophthora sojae]|uniref:HAT C-terminal dimerisation domain-containing protein n=1 Tax=Phytophthora sojae (strain P6497) TaxID=1094619 RepID=G4Z686_PHYSP|nr:hypothetical protein PHYSODRAFT_329615 [Phytophthora sojae]EGZ21701.1 hypothetical protein PHYSODRAFT_329615 [Phytophthora sojae]|eukprot:XP_009524418.1 hypothetical protein PHYSODRAFT_329615 [Phytophthora sojae]
MYDPNDLEVKALINDAAQLAQDLQLVPTELAEKFHKQLQDFVLMKSAWTGKSREDNNAYSPIAWWSLETSNTYALVQEFAKLLLYIPTSSASSERSWSIHGFIHTKLRNRLTLERVNKLVFVYTNIARKSEVNHILYQLYPDAYDDSDISDESEDEEDENVASNHHRAAVTAITSECEEKEAGEVVQEAAAPAQNMFRTPPASQYLGSVEISTSIASLSTEADIDDELLHRFGTAIDVYAYSDEHATIGSVILVNGLLQPSFVSGFLSYKSGPFFVYRDSSLLEDVKMAKSDGTTHTIYDSDGNLVFSYFNAYDMFVDLASGTGRTMSARKRLQISYALSASTTANYASMSDLIRPPLPTDVVLPTYWVQEATFLPCLIVFIIVGVLERGGGVFL